MPCRQQGCKGPVLPATRRQRMLKEERVTSSLCCRESDDFDMGRLRQEAVPLYHRLHAPRGTVPLCHTSSA